MLQDPDGLGQQSTSSVLVVLRPLALERSEDRAPSRAQGIAGESRRDGWRQAFTVLRRL